MTAHDYTTDPEQLRAHASRLASHGDSLSSIGSRLPNTMAEQSLGIFAQFITTALGGVMTATQEAYAHAASAMDKVGEGMRKAADDYERTEQEHTSGLGGIGTSLEEGQG